MKNRLVAILVALWSVSAAMTAAVTYCAPSAFGYGQSATGGGSATPVLVSSVSQLQSALNKAQNKVIIITQDLTFTTCMKVQDGKNVTLMGLPGVTLTSLQQDKSTSGILFIKRFDNFIIRNLTFVGPGAYDCDGWDLLCFENVTNAWVDHCDFQDGCDGNFDNKANTDNVTVSWCRFRYLKAPRSGGSGGSDDHRFTNLLGSSDSDAPSDGKYSFTWAYCWWDEGCKERMIRCRNAELHFLNCYWNSSVANYYVGPYNTNAYFEGCTFEGKANTKDKIFKSYKGTNACEFVDCSGNLPSNSGSVSAPTYSYTASGRAEAKTAVTNATCGAGATLIVTTSGAVSSTCDGSTPQPTVFVVIWNATTNGGSCGTATSLVTDGNAVGSLPEATRDGYTFDGWFTKASGGTKITSSTTVTGNVTYYAQFTEIVGPPAPEVYTVVWDANGGTCATTSSTVEEGQAIGTLPTATKEGDYTFDGWYTAINGGTKIETTTKPTGNVTYYAHYTATGGGGGGGSCETLAAGTQNSAHTAIDATVGTITTTGGAASDDHIKLNGDDWTKYYFTVTAKTGYTPIAAGDKLTVTVYNKDNSAKTLGFKVKNGDAHTKSVASKVEDNIEYTLAAGDINADGTITISRSASNDRYGAILLERCGGSSTPTFTLSYDENGGSGTMADETGTTVTVKACGFTAPTGYSFKEWNTEKSGGIGTEKAEGDEITLTEDMTLYAIWKPNTYTITLKPEGGTGGTENVTATFDAAMPDITIPSRSDYIFRGYYSGTDGTGTQYYDENGSSMNSWTTASDAELHAYWESGSVTPVTGCNLHFWFFASADETANGKSNDGTVFSGMVANSTTLNGSITIDGTSYTVTGRTGDHASFGSFTIPAGKSGVFYALAVSSGNGDRQINLECGGAKYEFEVAGGSDSYKRIESEELPAGTYSIERDGTSNVRLGVVVVKLCDAEAPSAAPTISGPTDATYCSGDVIADLSVTASGSGTLSYQWKKDGVDIDGAEAKTYTPIETGTYACAVTNEETGKSPTTLLSDAAVVTINEAVATPTLVQTENTVSLATATVGATIYYTTDGTNPTTTSASGTSVTITADCTVKAYAVKGICFSAVGTLNATYDASACTEPALMTDEIARFFVPCGLTNASGTAWNVVDEAASTGMNTFSTYKFGGSASNWYTNSTSKWIYGKLTSDEAYIQIKLNSGSFKAGDKVYLYVNRASATKTGVKLHSTDGNEIAPASTASEVEAEGVYTLVAADIEADGSLKFFRANSSTYINRIIIIREACVDASITTQPTTPVATAVGSECTITGLVAAGTNLSYQWQTCNNDGSGATNISAAGAMSFSGYNSATLSLTPTAAGTTYYKCVISGDCGEPVSSNVVAVNAAGPSAAPTISVQPVGATYCAGATPSALSVTATGSGTVTYQWKKDGVNIASAEAATYSPTESGTYMCVVTNTEGGKTPTSLSSDVVEVIINAAIVAPTVSQTGNKVSMTTSTAGATIYYTTNGADPTTSSTTGTSVTITADCTVKAFAEKDGCSSSIESFAATYDPDACTEPATLANEIARFQVPCDVDRTQAYDVTGEPYGATNTFTTSSFGGGSSNWYYNETTKLSYGKMNSSSGLIITIRLNTGSFQEGDVVHVYGNRNNATKGGVKVGSTTKYTIGLASTASGVEAEGTYTLTEDDIELDGSLNFYRESSSSYINRIIIVRPVPHSITYDCDGAESGCPGNVTTAYALPNPLPNAPVKGGFVFDGWYTNSAKTEAAVAGAELTADVTLYAKWVVDLPAPTFTWTYTDPLPAGGRYPINVASTGDADVTLSIVSAVGGVELSSAAGNPATGTVSLASSPAATTLTVRATSAATANYKAHSEDKEITITICETAYNLAYGVGYTDGSSKSKPRYYHETMGVGRLTKGTGGSTCEGDDASWEGEAWITKSNKNSSHLLQTYMPNVHKIVLYGIAGSNNTIISALRISDSYISGDSEGEDGLVGATVVYNNDPAQTSMTKNAQETVTITFATPLKENDFVYVVFSASLHLYGAKLYHPEGTQPTSVAYSATGDVNKFDGDPNFTRVATQTTSGIPSNGVITYSSSEEMVATVDAHTGEVTINGVGRARIIATLNACGCFAASEASYNLIVKPCSDPECTIAVTDGSAKKCAGASVMLTATAETGATIRWYKDDALLAGETNATLTTTEPGEYYATAYKACLQKSNTITVANLDAPTAEALHEYYYVKSGRVTPDIPLFKVTNTASFLMSHSAPSGCTYELRDDNIVYLTGIPARGLSATSYTLTITAQNPCGGANATASMNFRLLAQTAKPTLAWIAEGDKGQTLPGTVESSHSTGHTLYQYLENYFTLTPVNAYCTINEKDISDYYSQFDLILLTDYPNSHTCPDGLSGDANSYSNAIGSLIDEKPILTFEAFVAGLPNWGINTTPGPQSPNQKEITLLCSAHNIFDHTVPVDEKIKFVTSSGLQGFSGLETPPGMIYIATIPDGSGGTRITCCERQVVIPARMMIMGLNYNAMASVTDEGKTIIKQIIEYLLQTTNIADCAMVFDDANNTHIWSDPQNWAPAHNAIPKPFQAVRIKKDCQVNVADAHCSSVRLMKGNAEGEDHDAHLTILPTGGLTVTDYIKEVHDDNYLTTYPISSGDLFIQSSEAGNGALVFGNEEENLAATVEYYSKASGAGSTNPVWQYIGIPIQDKPMAINAYYKAWMCSWENVGNVSSNWTWVENENRIVPFKGYCITQEAVKTYTHAGTLNAPEEKNLSLRYFTSVDGDGFNMFANSWVAPIDITKIEVADFGAAAEATIFIYNAGTRTQYEGGGEPSTAGTNTAAGQYNAIPVAAASYMSGALTKIPTMQGFFIQATKNGTLTLDYDKLCFNTSTYETSTEPTRAPRRANAEEPAEDKIVPEVMRLDVNSAHWGDVVYIMTHSEFSDAFNLGWDGTKQEGDAEAPMLAFVQGNKLLAVAAVESAEERELSFRAGEDTEYTFTFNYAGEKIYLYDRLASQATEIKTGNTYSFTASNKTPMPRFLITKNPPQLPTDIDQLDNEQWTMDKARKMIIDGQLFILRNNCFYDARGARVTMDKKEVAQ